MKLRCCSVSFRTMFACAAASICLLAACGVSSAQRLPQTVRPEHYSLTLAPDLKAATFTGVETIDVTLSQAQSSITLNSAEITFESVTIAADGKQQTATVTSDKEKEQTTFTVPNEIPAGKATIAIN